MNTIRWIGILLHAVIQKLLRMINVIIQMDRKLQRLSSSITKETKKAKELFMEYNETSSQLDICGEHSPLQLQEVLPINSELWQSSPLPECMTSRRKCTMALQKGNYSSIPAKTTL